MKRNKGFPVLLTALCLSLVSCVNLKQPSHKITYYTFEYESPAPNGLQSVEEVIRVLRFSVAPPYNTTQLIYRDQAFQRMAYNYHKWRANPGDLVFYYLCRDLKQSGLFRAVLPHDSKIPSTCLLEGTVDEFFEWDAETTWTAALTVSITLMSEREPDISRRILLQKHYQEREPCGQKNPESLAAAMSRAMENISGRIMRDIHEKLGKR